MNIQTHYGEFSASSVVESFVKKLEFTEGRTLFSYEWFFDPVKGMIIVRMYLKTPDTPTAQGAA